MSEYQVWWKVKETGQILNDEVTAENKEDAKKVVLKKNGYKAWDVVFSTVKIV